MKKFIAVLFFVFAITAGSYTTSSAAEYLLGVRGGYFVWDPYLKNLADLFENMDTGSGALYGPVASVILTDDLSLSISGLFGSQVGEGKTEGLSTDSGTRYQDLKFSFNTLRIDIDSALSYRLGENIKIFGGYKFWYLKTKYSALDYRYDATTGAIEESNSEEVDLKQPFHGPAAGLGFSVPIGGRGYFFAANVSGLYMWGKMKMDGDPRIEHTTNTSYHPMDSVNINTQMYGANIEPTIGLNPGEDLPIFTIGVRYQYNRIKLDKTPADMGMSDDWMTDQIYGVFVGILYKI